LFSLCFVNVGHLLRSTAAVQSLANKPKGKYGHKNDSFAYALYKDNKKMGIASAFSVSNYALCGRGDGAGSGALVPVGLVGFNSVHCNLAIPSRRAADSPSYVRTEVNSTDTVGLFSGNFRTTMPRPMTLLSF